MKTSRTGTFKADLSEVIKKVPKTIGKKPSRKLGILEGKGKIEFGTDFKITKEEFLGS